MWYVGSIILIILFVFYMKSKIGNNDSKPYDEPAKNKKKKKKKPDNHDDRRDFEYRRYSHRRHNSPVRTAGSMMSNSSRSARERNYTSYRAPSGKSNSTPRGGGTSGSRGSTSNNNNPGGGRR